MIGLSYFTGDGFLLGINQYVSIQGRLVSLYLFSVAGVDDGEASEAQLILSRTNTRKANFACA